MKQPLSTKRNFSASEKRIIVLMIIFLAIMLFLLGLLIGSLLIQTAFQLPAHVAATSTSLPTSVAPVASVPTVDCGSSTLMLASTTFQIQNLTAGADSSLAVPADTPGIAYWVQGTDSNYVFVLSPTPENIALQTSLKSGDGLTVFWQDCHFKEYTISAMQAGQVMNSSLLDQSNSGITILIQGDPSATGFVIQGMEKQASDTSEISADISLVETAISPDQTTIRIGISILNFGTAPFTLSAGDVSLIPENAEPLGMISAEPPLPQEIGPGANTTIYFSFPHPNFPSAALKIFSIEFDVEGY